MESQEPNVPLHRKMILGVELEGYTILSPGSVISRKIAFHRKGTAEKGERFSRDWSIGTEYNSRPFSTIREGFFLLKSGLRKYNTSLYRSKTRSRKRRQIFLVGGWNDRFAAAHIHVSLSDRLLVYSEAKKMAAALHDHLPLLIAMTANSPVWADEITETQSTRVLRGSRKYFRPIVRMGLTRHEFDEMVYSAGRKTKPPTLEIRVMDSNLPEYVMAAACIVKASLLAFLRRKRVTNRLTAYQYLKSRQEAAKKGMAARLCWKGEWMPAADYLDRFVWCYREELKELDIPEELWTVFKLLKKTVTGSRLVYDAAKKAYRAHPPTWQKRFAKRYIRAISNLLSGNTLHDFIRDLGLKVPDVSKVWLGRKKLELS